MNQLKDLPKDRCGGVVVLDKINNEYIVLMGSKNKNNHKIYEYFGGNNEPEDLTALHTSIRELIEEMFNVKISNDNIEQLVLELLKNQDIKMDLTYVHPNENMTYFIGFDVVEKIYNYIKYGQYKAIDKFDIIKFIKNRKINNIAKDGLNEIKELHLKYLHNVPNLKLRPVAEKITNHLLKKL